MKPTPGSQLALFATYSYHGFITDRDGETLELEADHRRHGRDRERHPGPQVRRRAEPPAVRPIRRQRRLAGGTGDGPQPGPLDGPHRLARADRDHQDPPASVLRPGGTDHPLGAPPHFASSQALALGNPVQQRPGPAASHSTPRLTALSATAPTPPNSRPPRPRVHPAASDLTITRFPASIDRSPGPVRLLKTLAGSHRSNEAQAFSLAGSLIPICPAFTPPIGGFGLSCRFRPSAASIPSSTQRRRTRSPVARPICRDPGNAFILHGPFRMGLITQQQDAPVGLLVCAARPRHTNVFSSCRSSALSLTRYLFISIPSAHAPILFDLGLVDYSGSVLNSKMFDC